MSPELPDCDEVWAKYFARWYRPEDRQQRGYSATRADADRFLAPGTTATEVTALSASGLERVSRQLQTMLDAVIVDWPGLLGVEPPLNIEWIGAFDDYYDRTRVAQVLAKSRPEEFSNELVVLSCELGVALGEVMRAACPQLVWLHDWPYWESSLLDEPSGYRINVFDWGIKRFSEYGVEDGYVAKTCRVLELVQSGWAG